MIEAVKVGGEFLINTETAGGQSQPAITGLSNGGFVAAWIDYGFGAIKAQVFDAKGGKLGSEFLVSTGTDGSGPTATALSNGSFVIAWADRSHTLGDDSRTGIAAQMFDASGAALGSKFLVNSEVNGPQGFQTITPLSNGGYAIAWRDNGGFASAPTKVQIFDATRGKIGGELFPVDANLAGSNDAPTITSLADGGFVVTWNYTNGSTPGFGSVILAQKFDATGVPVGGNFEVHHQNISPSELSANRILQAVTGLAGGGFVVTWEDFDHTLIDNSGSSIQAQVFDSVGSAVGNAFLVNSQTAGDQLIPAISPLANGGFVITWTGPSNTGNGDPVDIRAQVFDSEGAKQGSEFLVAAPSLSPQNFPAITGLADGGFVVAWEAVSGTLGDSDSTAVHAQIFSLPAPFNTITGTALKNILPGTGGDDHLFGLAGNDTLSAFAGNDLLDGGQGSDKMSGGIGDDIYVVDASGDKVIENAGEGTDTVQTTLAKYTLGKNIENLTFTDGAAHKGAGNVLDNHIIAGAGNDLLDGKAGADTMEGGAGDDLYYVDNVGDGIVELTGGGTDSVIATVSYVLSNNVENLTLKSGKLALDATGNASDNVLIGNSNANVVSGVDGNDTLYGGKGNDTLTGGAGADSFVFDTAPSARSNLDTVTDFVSGTDRLVLDQSVFKGFAAVGAIAAEAFWSGDGVNTAHDANDRLIYNTSNGTLWYDADGNGKGKAIESAELAGHPMLDFADILIAA